MIVTNDDALVMLDREQLGDHPAHRHPDDVRRPDIKVVEQPGGVVGHVAERVGRRAWIAPKQRPRVGTGASRRIVERPMSRLSKRITLKPRPASVRQKSSSQAPSARPNP